MTSEIRANTIKNRVGLGTIEYSNTGPVISGVTTAFNFKTGTSNLHSTGLNIFDLDVDGHTNLDNVSIAGITTFATDVKLSEAEGKLEATGSTGLTLNASGGSAFARIRTAGNERLRIRSDGAVGINTTGNYSNIALSIFGADVGEGTAKGQLILKDTAAYDASPTAGIIFQGIHAAGSQAIFSGIRGFKENAGNGDYAGALAFDVRAHGAVAYEAVRITSAGRVGIGTDNPQTIFHISDNVPTIRFTDENSTGVPDCEIGGAGGNIDISADINGEKSDSVIRFNVDGGEKVRITSDGDLSLRSTTQNAFLGLTANSTAINFTLGSTAGSSPRMYFYGTGNGQSSAGDIFTGSGTGGILHYRSGGLIKFEVNSDNSTTEALHITADGLVGIGPLTPEQDLHIKKQKINPYCKVESTHSSSTYTGINLKTPTLNFQIWNQGPGATGYSGSNSVVFWQAAGTGPYAFYHGTNEKLRITPDGKVGVNNTSPARTMDIKPEAGATDSNLALTCGNTTGYSQLIFANSNDQYRGGLYYHHDTDRMRIYGGGGQRDIAEFEAPGGTAYMGVGNYLSASSNDGNWGARFNLYATDHAKLELYQHVNAVRMKMWVHSGHSRGYLGTQSNHPLYLHTSNDSNKSLVIDTDGRFTAQKQPSFAAYRSQNDYTLNNSIFTFNATKHNVGGHFSTSTHRFTAPVAGRYLFTFWAIYNTNVTNAYYTIRINGSAGSGMYTHFSKGNSNWNHVSSSYIFSLNQNDYVDMFSNSNVNWHGNSWQLFCGQLLS